MSKRSTDWDLYHNFLLLVVNSNPEESEHLKVRFEDEGFKVILAENFDRCMDILEGESVDVLVTDFNVDGIEGKELVSSIKRKYPSLPVIVTGGDLSEENITALIDCNVFGLFCVKNQLEQLAAQSTKAVEKQAKQIGKKDVLDQFIYKKEYTIKLPFHRLGRLADALYGSFVSYGHICDSENDEILNAIKFVFSVAGKSNDAETLRIAVKVEKGFVQILFQSEKPIFTREQINKVRLHDKDLADLINRTIDKIDIDSSGYSIMLEKGVRDEGSGAIEVDNSNIDYRKFKVLVVDDSIAIREDIKTNFLKLGLQVEIGTDGAEGLVKFRDFKPDLIISDVVMPKIDGFKFCKIVKNGPQKDNVYFILLTSQGRTSDKVVGFNMGADDYLTKPYEMDELKARLNTGLRIMGLQKEIKENNRLLQEQHSQIMNDINTAGTIQRGLLPDMFDGIKEARVFTKYLPCRFVGGDYFDVEETAEKGKWAIFSGDVSGHGLGATYITAMAKMSFKMNAPRYKKASDIMRAMNRELSAIIHTGDFITAFLMVFDEKNRSIEWVKAGHPPPIVYRNNGDKPASTELLEAPGLPLAIFDMSDYEDLSLQLSKGDRIYVYTDGIIEALDSRDEMYGMDRLVDLIENHHFEDIGQTVEYLMADVKQHSGPIPLEDDISHVVLEVL